MALLAKISRVCSHVFPSFSLYTQIYKNMSPQTGKFTAHHSTFQEFSDFFNTSEALEATKNEKYIESRQDCTTLLTATPSDTINPGLLRVVGFNPKKAPAIVLPDVETISEAKESELDSDQEPTRTGGPQATPVRYTQPCPEAVEAGQAGNKCGPILKKPSTSLPTLAAARALHLPIDNAQVAWLDHFLTKLDIPNNVCPKHQQCGLSQHAPKVYLCPVTVYC